MKKLLFGLTAALLTTVSFGQTKQSSYVEVALQKTLMVGTVEMFQRGAPAGVTAEDFNKQLTLAKVTPEGRLFLNRAFAIYKKGTAAKDILITYDGKESKGVMLQLANGGVNPFGDLANSAEVGKGKFWGWLAQAVQVLLGVIQDVEVILVAVEGALQQLAENGK